MSIALKLFRYEELATLIVTVLIVIVAVEWLSRTLRGRLGATTRTGTGSWRRAFLGSWR